MRSLNQWFSEYAVSHQNKTTKLFITYVFRLFSIVILLMSIPLGFLKELISGDLPLIENWASFLLIFVLVCYFSLSISMGLRMLLFAVLCLVGNYFISLVFP